MSALGEIEQGIESLLMQPPYGVDPQQRHIALLALLKKELAYACDRNSPFRNYVEHWPIDFRVADRIADLPYLPVGVFKASPPLALVGADDVKRTLTSSATTGQVPSRVVLMPRDLWVLHSYESLERYSVVKILCRCVAASQKRAAQTRLGRAASACDLWRPAADTRLCAGEPRSGAVIVAIAVGNCGWVGNHQFRPLFCHQHIRPGRTLKRRRCQSWLSRNRAVGVRSKARFTRANIEPTPANNERLS